MFSKILVPLDGSTLAERALNPAFVLGQQAEGEVVLMRVATLEGIVVPAVHSYGGYGLVWPDQSLERSRHDAEAYLKSIQKFQAPARLAARGLVADGDVAEAIVDAAAAEKADLILMSSHGYSGVSRWVLGSVAEKVLRSAPCPVMLIRSPRSLRHILIPLDGSALSEQALRPGLEVAACFGAQVTLLRAVQHVNQDELDLLEKSERGLGSRLEDEIQEEAKGYLLGLAASSRPAGLIIKTLVTTGPAAEGILRQADTRGVALIVISTHGRSGLRRWVYGSVTEKVLRGSQHSMLIVRPAGFAPR